LAAQRVPDDLRAAVGRREEKFNLKRRDLVEAKRLCAQALIEIEQRWSNLRAPICKLDNSELHRISIVIYEHYLIPVRDSLMRAFEAANRAILEHGKNNANCRGMGTTCTALAVHSGQVWLAHVGDSRAYLLRKGQLTRLTKDQTLHAQMVRDGLMTEEESKTAGGSNVILQALGTGPDVVVWEKRISLVKGDILILCSDGLWNLVADETIAQLASGAAPQEACQKLVDAALEAGGYDNVSVGVFLFDEPGRFRPTEVAKTRTISLSGESKSPESSIAATAAPSEKSCG
jgi:serine/threonine protein phosphatase PrpC